MEETDSIYRPDTLAELNRDIPLSKKLDYIRGVLNQRFPCIDRISVAIYDPQADLLKTFIQHGEGNEPLSHYQYRLSESEALLEISRSGVPRVINDMDTFNRQTKPHSKRIRDAGYQASYTLPMFLNSDFFGFVFFNSRRKHVFTGEVLHYLDLFGHLLSLTVINELSNLRTLLAAVKTARDITHHRDFETGSHLDRMSRYARLIAMEIAPKYGLDDEFIEHIFMFSPLHDIGKIGIPDNILLKPGKLDEQEFEVMKTHAEKGRSIIDSMLENFGLDGLQRIDILRNIAEHHHEAMNGEGYPRGLRGDEIPIESRIIAVADVFDALTSHRPYKDAWSNSQAFAILKSMAGTQLDSDCVEALLNNRDRVEQIQERFHEDPYG